MPKSKVKVKAVAQIQVPQTPEEVNDFIRRLGAAQQELAEIEIDLTRRIDEEKASAERHAKPHKDAIKLLSRGVQTYCEAHRKELTRGGQRKFFRFAAGEVKWRMTPPAVKLKHKVAIVLANLQLKPEWKKFIRWSKAIDKEAMLADQDLAKKVPGVTIAQAEEFVIRPNESKLEEVI